VPYARAYNPITKKTWEGVGVIPHVEASYGKALARAAELALAEIGKTGEVTVKNPTP
jgi:DNA-binding protein H-NS